MNRILYVLPCRFNRTHDIHDFSSFLSLLLVVLDDEDDDLFLLFLKTKTLFFIPLPELLLDLEPEADDFDDLSELRLLLPVARLLPREPEALALTPDFRLAAVGLLLLASLLSELDEQRRFR